MPITKSEVVQPSAAPTHTAWSALDKAKLKLITIQCADYFGRNRDFSCHTKFPATVENIKRHMEAEHSGRFLLTMKVSDGKPSKFWEELASAGLEAQDFRCDVCEAQVRFHPSAILPHLRPHRGKTKRAYSELLANNPGAQGMFGLGLGSGVPEKMVTDEDEFGDE